MTNPRTVVVLGAAQIDSDGLQWIEVIPTATKVRNGPFFFTITEDDLDAYAQSIQSQPGLIPVDYDHEGAIGGSTAAAGWFTGETQIVAAGAVSPGGETQDHTSLWGRVKWTPQAQEEIRDGRFKRLSPEFNFHERNTKTGLLTRAKEIVASTLTNRPFFRELAPVGADLLWDARVGYRHIAQQLDAALNKPGEWNYCVLDIDIAGSRALVESTREANTYVIPYTVGDGGDIAIPPSTDWTEAQQEWVAAARAALAAEEARRNDTGREATTEGAEMPDMKALAAALGLPEDATEEQIIEAAKAAKAAKTPPAPAKSELSDEALAEVRAALGLPANADEAAVIVAARAAREGSDRVDATEEELEQLRATAAQNQTLGERVKALEAERKSEKVRNILREATREGRVFPAEKVVLAKQYATDPDGLLELLATRPKRTFKEQGSGLTGGGDVPENVRAVSDEFESVEADGVDQESAVVHARAVQYLKEQGKHKYTEDEYADAVVLAYDDRC